MHDMKKKLESLVISSLNDVDLSSLEGKSGFPKPAPKRGMDKPYCWAKTKLFYVHFLSLEKNAKIVFDFLLLHLFLSI